QDFYNRLTGEIHYFENNCPTGTMSRKAKPVIIPKAKPTAMPLCVFPNPASSNIRITGKQIQQVKIVDIWGKIILNNSYNNEAVMNINISKLPQGMYIVQAMQKDGIVLTNKLIKQ
ncbi:MAG: T9SS type A sorting domain-containing protein, partial [Bacteroidetes bacterium]|nr:T9SS type A sorting domain-containing protein [Bacteroidota bacterium]